MKTITVHSKTHGIYQILVDDEDYKIVSKYKWSVIKREHTLYAFTSKNIGNKKTLGITMHRMLMGDSAKNMQIDHKDGNGLNNQRGNIRLATISQNAMNRRKHRLTSSKHYGVSKKTQIKHFKRVDGGVTTVKYEWWRASITIEGKVVSKMGFKSEEDAAKWRDELAKKHHGEFANLNFKD